VSEPAFLTIAETSRLIAKRALSPVELTEACLRRIETLDSQLDSFVTVTAERARAEAKAAEAAIMTSRPLSRLHGIPY
jgi:aspartyl-tRNA(Asn)/glutamyl-tRNA(Gln) amidotransferase subunit A